MTLHNVGHNCYSFPPSDCPVSKYPTRLGGRRRGPGRCSLAKLQIVTRASGLLARSLAVHKVAAGDELNIRRGGTQRLQRANTSSKFGVNVNENGQIFLLTFNGQLARQSICYHWWRLVASLGEINMLELHVGTDLWSELFVVC